jgi:putative membrane protein
MGGMMGATAGGWMVAWILLGVALAVLVAAGGVLAARALGGRHRVEPSQITSAETASLQEARDALRLRYARGEIDREEYLQGKVELED